MPSLIGIWDTFVGGISTCDHRRLSTLHTKIFQIGYKKLRGKQLSEADQKLLGEIQEDPFMDILRSPARYIAHILKSDMSKNGIYRLNSLNTAAIDVEGVRQLVPAQEKYSGSTKLCTYEEIQNQCWGREIDILVKHDQGSSNFIELSSLDVKPASAGAAVVKGQQN
ncbi:predicted protein [Lichtheimia corymbifera JMRC:FSU:9682]|uniref:Uncharacterized protein n=1 Tax=Lichtheimia corymbifera JMRC:FSU:9682 TaxID=1263082 RepID=A0A068RS95_9FUNG|nr:predicted protein [Lichtheimia corymbifera JMRC:FSU:9682]